MENGDRQKVLQHRLLGIYPDHLDFQRIVAWSGGSHIPPAIHVSNSHPGSVVGDNFGLVHSALVSRDTSVNPVQSGVYFIWRLYQRKGSVIKAQ